MTISATCPPKDELLGEDLLFGGATFMPDDDPVRIDALLETVWRTRYTMLVTLYLELLEAAPDVSRKTGFEDTVLGIMASSAADTKELVSEPAFLIWLNMAIRATHAMVNAGTAAARTTLSKRLSELALMRERFEQQREHMGTLRLSASHIRVQRFDIDRMIASVTPPSYTFPSKKKQAALERQGYSLRFFRDVLTAALERIQVMWPECHEHFVKLVKVIGYLPDADFRSCSAARYTGVIYLAARDNSIMDIEESLVHEAGHQLLYHVVEAQRVTRDDTSPSEMYSLPWSDQERDFYGYFHAFFIYVILAKYFERFDGARPRSVDRSDDDRRQARSRLELILRGLRRALPDFDDNPNFTPHGRELYRAVRAEVLKLLETHRRLLASNDPIAMGSSSYGVE